MSKSEKENNSVKCLQNFIKINQVIYNMYPKFMSGYNLYATYHDPSSRGSLDILCTRSFMHSSLKLLKKCLAESGKNGYIMHEILGHFYQTIRQVSWRLLYESNALYGLNAYIWKGE